MSRRDESHAKAYCDGKYWSGPDRHSFYITVALIILPQVPFLVLICPYYTQYISVGVYVIAIYLCISCIVFLTIAGYTDPGIIPRGHPPPEEENPFSIDQKLPLVKKVVVKGVEIDTKWCDTCNIYRPLRSSHCSICNNCVEKFDHHCPWIGNCVGRRNYRYYLFFVNVLFVECLLVIALSVVHIILNTNESPEPQRSDAMRDALSKSYYFSIILSVYALGGLCFVGSLSGFHCFLAGANVTTNEQIKKTYKGRKNPNAEGLLRNYMAAYCGPWYPSAVSNVRSKQEMRTLPSVGHSTASTSTLHGDTAV